MHEPYGLASHEAGGHNDLIIYGHTHESEWRPQELSVGDPPGAAGGSADAGGVPEGLSSAIEKLVINPGEVCGWVTGRATFVLFDLAAWRGELVQIG
jgi:hypothetical protein